MMEDRHIMELFTSGRREQAFSLIVQNYSERLYWSVRRLVFSHDDADDLVQEIYIRIWSALPTFRWESSLYTWIYRIATNESLNFLKKQKVRSSLSFKSLTSEIENKLEDDPYFNGSKVQLSLAKSVAKLPSRQRLVFNLRYYDQMKYEDMSEILDVSVGSLKASYHIACEKIKKDLCDEF